MHLAQDNDVVHTLTPDRSDQPFGNAILPRRGRCNRSQDNQLMSKHRVLGFKPQLRLEWRGQDGQDETEQPDHSASLGDSVTSSTRIGFLVHTGSMDGLKLARFVRDRWPPIKIVATSGLVIVEDD